MLIPAGLPLEFAWINARFGVPCHGEFAAHPAPVGEEGAWAYAVPWAIRLLGPVLGEPVLLMAPTPPGVAALLRPAFAIPVWHGHAPVGLPCVDADPAASEVAAFVAALRLNPCGDPPSVADQEAAARWVRPGGRLGLVWAGNRTLRLAAAWRPVVGNPAELLGLPEFDDTVRAAALQQAWAPHGVPIAALVCERS